MTALFKSLRKILFKLSLKLLQPWLRFHDTVEMRDHMLCVLRRKDEDKESLGIIGR